MPETRRRYDTEFREGGVQHVTEPNRSIVACPRPGTRDPGPWTNEGTLGNGLSSSANATAPTRT